MSLHILAGEFKGRKLLPPPRQAETRPMTGHIKKSLFGMLGPWLEGAVVVDLYCGTGTLGLEALSQGAASCCFADRDGGVLAALKENIRTLGVAGRCTLWGGDVTARLAGRLASVGGAVDIAFVDPPFETARHWSWRQAEGTIFVPLAEHLATDGIVVLRLPDDVQPPEALGRLRVQRVKPYGGMSVVFLAFGERIPEDRGTAAADDDEDERDRETAEDDS
jgi:16S rRNA (guanine(966)-N(2))-methyltransferase RsmD